MLKMVALKHDNRHLSIGSTHSASLATHFNVDNMHAHCEDAGCKMFFAIDDSVCQTSLDSNCLLSNVVDCPILCRSASQTPAALFQWYEGRIDDLKQKLYSQQPPKQHCQLPQQDAGRPVVDASTPDSKASSSTQGLSSLTSKAPEFVPKNFSAKRASQGVPSSQRAPYFYTGTGQNSGSHQPRPPLLRPALPPRPPPQMAPPRQMAPPPQMAYLNREPSRLPLPPPDLLMASQRSSAASRPVFNRPQVWQHQAPGAVQSVAGKIILHMLRQRQQANHMQRLRQQANQGMLLRPNPLFTPPQQQGGLQQARTLQGMTNAIPPQPQYQLRQAGTQVPYCCKAWAPFNLTLCLYVLRLPAKQQKASPVHG